MEKAIIFELTPQYSIKIILPCSKQELVFCDNVSILFVDNNKDYLLYDNDTILWALRCLSSSLEMALQDKLQLPKFIKDSDVGDIWNKTIHDTVSQPDNKSFPYEWQDNYLIWNFRGFALWIYNENDSIYIEITPVYKWNFIKPTPNEQFLPYEQFMNDYKPILTFKLDKKIAQKLLDESQNLLQKLLRGQDLK